MSMWHLPIGKRYVFVYLESDADDDVRMGVASVRYFSLAKEKLDTILLAYQKELANIIQHHYFIDDVELNKLAYRYTLDVNQKLAALEESGELILLDIDQYHLQATIDYFGKQTRSVTNDKWLTMNPVSFLSFAGHDYIQ